MSYYIQQPLYGLDLPAPVARSTISSLSPQPAERGAVFTRSEVVEFMLDLAGYCREADLAQMSLLEPCFGQGDFLFAAVERLLDSAVHHHGSLSEALPLLQTALRAVEIHQETFLSTRDRLLLLLQRWGIEQQDARQLVDLWLIHDDFLLTTFSSHFTHVVGNPPYVRQELLPDVLLVHYRTLYRTIYDRADLYVPFIERGLSLLSEDGTLSFICSDRWMKNRYGGPLRTFISQKFSLRYYVDMTRTDAFQTGVTAYPAITVFTLTQTCARPIHRDDEVEACAQIASLLG